MFDVFGEFDSAEEINKTALGLRNEKDMDGLLTLCRENGLDPEDAKDFMDGCFDELANDLMAALGKIQVESDDLEPKDIMEDWIGYIKLRCMEDGTMAKAVRRKGKSIKGCIAKIVRWSFEHSYDVDDDIRKMADINAKCKMGIPGMGQSKKIITEYYLN